MNNSQSTIHNPKSVILGTGLSGLVGSKFVQMFSGVYDFVNLDLKSGIDITDEVMVMDAVENTQSGVLLHFAAFTDANRANLEKGDKDGIVYKVNVLGTRNMIKAAKEFDRHLIHISTAYVFDGEKEGLYTEEDEVNPIEWYGQTKAWAEEEVLSSDCVYTILRIDQPYREDKFDKQDILHRIIQGLSVDNLPPMFVDHTFTPTKIEIFAQNLNKIIKNRIYGLYHATTEPLTNDYDFAVKIKKMYDLPGEVRPGNLKEYLKRAKRPYQKNTGLDVRKLQTKLAEK